MAPTSSANHENDNDRHKAVRKLKHQQWTSEGEDACRHTDETEDAKSLLVLPECHASRR